jgi:hypothetical protein
VRAQFVERHEAEFNSFGAIALFLEQIPIIGALFQITNFVGAALWVEKLDAIREWDFEIVNIIVGKRGYISKDI